MGLSRRSLSLALPLLAALPAAARAELQDLIGAKRVRIGVPVDVPPFGYVDASQQPIGLDVEFARMLAQGLGVEAELTQITGANRIPFLVTGKLDLVISALGATPERARQIAFSSPYATLSIGVFGPAALAVSGPGELGTHTVAVARGTTQDLDLTAAAPGAQIRRFDDDATAITAFLSGQAELLATANVVAREVAKSNPKAELAPKFIMRLSPCHVGLRQGNPELLRWVDTFIFARKVDGTLNKLSLKWIGSPFPDTFPTI